VRRPIATARRALNAAYRYAEPVFSPLAAAHALRAYPRYLRDRREYQRLPGAPRLSRLDDFPQLFDRTAATPFEPHYTFQDGWAAREVADLRPERHVDVGSRISFVIGLAAFVPVTFVDLRPLQVDLSGLEVVAGSILDLPFADRSVASLSCLHVAEHIGLGRYGDPLDPDGTRRAAEELARVLAPGGRLLVGLPVGAPRTEFNAHRIHDPDDVPRLFGGLRLERFAGVRDDGSFAAGIEPSELAGSRWACGLYRFARD
jgi:SAM-dependent methyltransferase